MVEESELIEPVKEDPPKKKTGWTSEQIKAVMDAHPELNHGKHAVAIMNLSMKLSPETGVPVLLKWFRVYQSEREDGAGESQSAAKIADEKTFE